MNIQKTLKIILLIPVGVFLIGQSFGQETDKPTNVGCPEEKIQMHLSQESAFTGEIIGFNIYCTSPVFPEKNISSLAFVELVSSDNSSLIRKKILLEKGVGVGAFEVPDLPTGVYFILAYTNWMKNFGETSFFKKNILIINPSEELKIPLNNNDSLRTFSNETNKPNNNADKINLICDKKSYSTRQQVTVRLEAESNSLKPLSGNFSVSVYRKEPQMIFQTKKSAEAKVVRNPEKIVSMPDYNGIRLSGKLTDSSGKIISGKVIYESTPGPGTHLKSCITDENGDFNFLLIPEKGEKEIVLTMPAKDSKISLEEAYWSGFRSPQADCTFGLNLESLLYLKKKYMDFQLQSKFKNQSFIKGVSVASPNDSSVFYSGPVQKVELKNYIRLDSLREYFHELFPAVKFNQRKGEVDISIFDPLNLSFLEDKPGVFLDGIIYDDYAQIANIPVNDIARIAVIPKTYYYKDFTFGGIVDIHTVKSDFNAVKPLPNMTRLIYTLADETEWKFGSPDYSVSAVRDTKPDFRYLLYWNPKVRIEKSEESAVHFYTGDVMGDFVIKVVGLTDEGEILQAESEISVND